MQFKIPFPERIYHSIEVMYRRHCLCSDNEYIEFHKGTDKNLGRTNPLKEYRHRDENLESI